MNILDVLESKEPIQWRCVVRLVTSSWGDGGQLHTKRTLRTMLGLSVGAGRGFLSEEVSMIGADVFIKHVTNFDQCEDGLYDLTTCNESRDWETNTIDDYDYVLIPYKP